MVSLSDNNQTDIMVRQIYPTELQLNKAILLILKLRF